MIREFRGYENGDTTAVLTTRGDMLARHKSEDIRQGGVPGLRRYRTQVGASIKAAQLNGKYNTGQYRAVREDMVGVFTERKNNKQSKYEVGEDGE